MMLHVSGLEELSLERTEGLSESPAPGQEGSSMVGVCVLLISKERTVDRSGSR